MSVQSRMRLPVLLVLGVAVVGCGSSNRSADARTAPEPDSAAAAAAPATAAGPFTMYTHCGVNGAKINGLWWEVTPPMSDGHGNPPDGWGNPYQAGVLTFTSDATAVFRATSTESQLLTATLRRTTSTEYPFICS